MWVILYVNVNKTEFLCLKKERVISTLSCKPLKFIDQFTYLDSKILSTENDVNIHLEKVLTATDRLWIIWNSDLLEKIKWNFFLTVAVSILLYECTC